MPGQVVGRTPPNGADVGDEWFFTDTATPYYWDGTRWVPPLGGTTPVGVGFTYAGTASPGGATLLTLTPGNHTAVAAEYHDIIYNGPTITVTANIANQRFIQLNPPTITAATAKTVTSAATLEIDGGPIAGANVTLTNSWTLWTRGGGLVNFGGTGSYAGGNTNVVTNVYISGSLGSPTAPYMRCVWDNSVISNVPNNCTVEGYVCTNEIVSAVDSTGIYYGYPSKLTVDAGVTLAQAQGFHLDTPVMTGNVTTYYGSEIQNLGGANVTTAVGWWVRNQSGSTNNTILLLGETTPTGTFALYSDSAYASQLGTGTLLVQGNTTIGTGTNASQAFRVNQATMTGTTQMGIVADATAQSGSTTAFWGIFARTHFAAASFTVTTAAAIEVDTPSFGASSAATSLNGIRIVNQGSASASNVAAINIADQSGGTSFNISVLMGSGPGSGTYSLYNNSANPSVFVKSVAIGQAGAAATATLLSVTPTATVVSATSAIWDGISVPATTLTLSGSTAVTTAAGVNLITIAQPTISAGSALTVTNAASLTILNAPTGGGAGPATLTNAYALWVQAGLTKLATLATTGKVTNYNAVATAGWGVPSIYTDTRPATQTNTTTTIATYTVGAADGTFEVAANVNVTTSTTVTMTVTLTYTDETNTSRVLTVPFFLLAGTLVQSITTAQGNIPYASMPIYIRCKTATTITLATAGTVTAVVYTAEGTIKQVA